MAALRMAAMILSACIAVVPRPFRLGGPPRRQFGVRPNLRICAYPDSDREASLLNPPFQGCMISDNAECFEIGKTQIAGHQILHNKRSQPHKMRGKKIDSSVAK